MIKVLDLWKQRKVYEDQAIDELINRIKDLVVKEDQKREKKAQKRERDIKIEDLHFLSQVHPLGLEARGEIIKPYWELSEKAYLSKSQNEKMDKLEKELDSEIMPDAMFDEIEFECKVDHFKKARDVTSVIVVEELKVFN